MENPINSKNSDTTKTSLIASALDQTTCEPEALKESEEIVNTFPFHRTTFVVFAMYNRLSSLQGIAERLFCIVETAMPEQILIKDHKGEPAIRADVFDILQPPWIFVTCTTRMILSCCEYDQNAVREFIIARAKQNVGGYFFFKHEGDELVQIGGKRFNSGGWSDGRRPMRGQDGEAA